MLATLARAEAHGSAPTYAHFSPAVQSLLALSPSGCRWPLTISGVEVSAFCGAPRLHRSSYCAGHTALACEPVR